MTLCNTATDCFYTTTIMSGFLFNFEEHYDNDDLVRKSVPEGEFGKGQFRDLGSSNTARLKKVRDDARSTYSAAGVKAANADAELANAELWEKNWCRRFPSGKSCKDQFAQVVQKEKAVASAATSTAAAKVLYTKAKAAFDTQSTADRKVFEAAKGRRRRRGEGSEVGGFSFRSAMNQLKMIGSDMVTEAQATMAEARNADAELNNFDLPELDVNNPSTFVTELIEPFTMKMSGAYTFPVMRVVFFFLESPPIVMGPVVLILAFGSSGFLQFALVVDVELVELRVTPWVEPSMGAEAFLSASFVFGPIAVGIKLTARILETAVPVFATTVFAKFPLQICFGGDLLSTPLSMALSVFIQIRICIWKCFVKTLFDMILWTFALPPIHKELFRTCDIDKDPSPPEFAEPAQPEQCTKGTGDCTAPEFKPLDDLNENPGVANCQVRAQARGAPPPLRGCGIATSVHLTSIYYP